MLDPNIREASLSSAACEIYRQIFIYINDNKETLPVLFWRHVSHIKGIILLDRRGYTETVVCKHSWLADVCIMLLYTVLVWAV